MVINSRAVLQNRPYMRKRNFYFVWVALFACSFARFRGSHDAWLLLRTGQDSASAKAIACIIVPMLFERWRVKKKFLFSDTPPSSFFLSAWHWFSIAWRLAGKVNEAGRQRHAVCALIPYLLSSWILTVDNQMFTITGSQYKKRCAARAAQRWIL